MDNGIWTTLIGCAFTFAAGWWATHKAEQRADLEMQDRERVREDERTERELQRRAEHYVNLLRCLVSVNQAVGEMAAANELNGLEPQTPAWQAATKSIQSSKLDLQEAGDRLWLLERNERSELMQCQASLVRLMNEGVEMAKGRDGVDRPRFAEWQGRTAASMDQMRILMRSVLASTTR